MAASTGPRRSLRDAGGLGVLKMPKVIAAQLQKYRFLQLTIMLILMLLLTPVLVRYRILGALAEVVMLDSLVVAASASSLGRKMRWPLLITWGVAIGSFAVGLLLLPPAHNHLAFVLCSFFYTLFSLGCTVAVLSFVAESHQGVNMDAILASVAAYVLLALSFSCLFSLLAMFDPQSFQPYTILSPKHPAHVYLTMIYFSLITLTTVGYGDITPFSGFAQMFSGVEALIGQLYLAILVAYLVGSHLSARLLERQKQSPPL